METMGNVFGLLGIVAFVMYFDLAKKVKKLERMIKDSGIVDFEKESLKDILKKNLGKTAKLELERGAEDSDFAAKECLIVDIDEEWLQIRSVKKGQEGLIRVDFVKGVQFV